jgi:pilus assembly protein CpaF
MVAMTNLNIPERAVRQQIASAINVMIQVTRLSDGTRKVTQISEITGMEVDVISLQDIFVFEREGVRSDGRVIGRFRSTGVRPRCSERLAAAGTLLSTRLFEHEELVA